MVRRYDRFERRDKTAELEMVCRECSPRRVVHLRSALRPVVAPAGLIETDERGARAERGDDGRAAQRSLGAGALRKDRRREDRQGADTALDAAH